MQPLLHPLQEIGNIERPGILSSGHNHITRSSFKDGMFYSLMVGFGETYFVAFALALGMNGSTAGMVSVLPLVIGSFVQIVALHFARGHNLSRNWVVGWAIVQALATLLMCGLAFVGEVSHLTTVLIFAFASLYWCAAQCGGTIWNSWISGIVAKDFLLQFFVQRTRLCQAATFVGLVLGGVVLRYSAKANAPMYGFMILFLGSVFLRLLSARYLATHPPLLASSFQEGDVLVPHQEGVWKWFKKKDTYPILAFLFVSNIAAYVSAPFFSPFMLGILSLDYGDYMILISAAFLARVFSSPFFYAIARRFKVRALVVVGALSVIPLPYLWTISDNFYYLIVMQLLSGFAWGAHELGVTLYLIERLPNKQRARLLGWANAFNSTGMLIGSSVGAALIASSFIPREGYIQVFLISSSLRILPLCFLVLWLREPVKLRRLFSRVMPVRPGALTVSRPVLVEAEEVLSSSHPSSETSPEVVKDVSNR